MRPLLILAYVLAALLLARFTADFYIEMPIWLAIPFSLLVVASLLLAGMNLRTMLTSGAATEITKPPAKQVTALLLAMVPIGFLVSALDCSGLAPQGCTPFCTFVKLAWIPLISIICLITLCKPVSELQFILVLLSFVPLMPHCVCYNVGNGWWIARLGASPMCYVWGFMVMILSLSAILSSRRVTAVLLVNAAIIGGALAFFVSHHYFHFPW